MSIRLANSDSEIASCYPVMRELRPHIRKSDFVSRVRSQEKSGYRLAFVVDDNGIVAVAGFRIGESLSWGRFLYVDDLVASRVRRSRAMGRA